MQEFLEGRWSQIVDSSLKSPKAAPDGGPAPNGDMVVPERAGDQEPSFGCLGFKPLILDTGGALDEGNIADDATPSIGGG